MSTETTSDQSAVVGWFKRFTHGRTERYPAWRYHEYEEPVIVHDTIEDKKWKAAGWDAPVPGSSTQVRHMVNWRFDLEDFSPRQLVQFAKDEFGVDLPVEAGEEKLFKSIWKLHVSAPENRDSVVLFAQSVEMNYDESLEEIRRTVDGELGEVERTSEDFWE